jgi:hypothetical protein
MSDQQVPTEPTEGDQDESNHRIQEVFGRKSSFGALQFLFEFWPAWMFNKNKHFAPICRIIIGDEDDGSVLVDKTVLVTGLLHLANDLASAVAFNIQRASELPGFLMDTPGGEPHVLELMDDLEGQIKEIRGMIEKNKLFAAIEDDEHDQ